MDAAPPAADVFANLAEFPPLSPPAAAAPGNTLDFFLDVPVTVTARLGEVVMPIGDLLKLGPGAVVSLDRDVAQPVDLTVRGVTFARGEVVVVDEHYAVRIKELLSPRGPGRGVRADGAK
jgi:flagellar motor switch protein FliN/FliY